MQQKFYDLITRETKKLANLKNSYSMLSHERDNPKKEEPPSRNEQAAANEIQEKIEFEEELKRDADQKALLLQGIINECAASGNPLPKSLIQLLHNQNGIYKKMEIVKSKYTYKLNFRNPHIAEAKCTRMEYKYQGGQAGHERNQDAFSQSRQSHASLQRGNVKSFKLCQG